MLRRLAPLLAVIWACAAVSCTVSQTVQIGADGSGTASLRVVMSRLLKGYLLSLAEAAGRPELAKEGKVFDLKEIRAALEARDGVTVKRVASPSPETLEIDLSYRSLADLFSPGDPVAGTGAVTLSESGGVSTLALHLDRRTYRRLTSALPLLQDPAFQGMGPEEGETISREDYLSMIQFSLGADGPGVLKKSFVELTVRPEGQIVSQAGGTVANGAVSFRIPLLSVLVLDKPLDYSVSFR